MTHKKHTRRGRAANPDIFIHAAKQIDIGAANCCCDAIWYTYKKDASWASGWDYEQREPAADEEMDLFSAMFAPGEPQEYGFWFSTADELHEPAVRQHRIFALLLAAEVARSPKRCHP